MSRPVDVGGFKPPPSSVGGAIKSGAGPAVSQVTHWTPPPAAHTEAPTPTDTSPAAGVTGSTGPQISQSEAYRRSVLAIFKKQSAKVQAALALKALKSPNPAGQIILNQLRSETKGLFGTGSLPQPVQQLIPQAQIYTALIARGVAPPGVGSAESPVLKAALHAVFMAQSPERRAQLTASGTRLGIIPKSGNFFDAVGYTASRVAGALSARTGGSQFSQMIDKINGIPSSPLAAGTKLGEKAIGLVGGALEQARRSTTPGGGTTLATIQGVTGVPSASQVVLNAAKDAVDLPTTALTTGALVAKDAANLNFGKVAKDFYQPPLSMLEHPKEILQHPLFAYLMGAGALHGVSRVAAAPLRAFASEGSGLAGKLSVERQPVSLGGNLQEPRPLASKSPTVKAMQKVPDVMSYTKAPGGELIPRAGPQGDWLHMRKTASAIGRMAGVAERIRRVGREQTKGQLGRIFTPHDSRLGRTGDRVATGITTALERGSKVPLVRGAELMGRFVDGTFRRPETLAADMQTHLNDVRSELPKLKGEDLAKAQRTVATLEAALRDKKLLKDPRPAFRSAAAFANVYRVLEARAHRMGFFRDMTAEHLERRTLAHMVKTHWPGARFDPELQTLVHDVPVAGVVRELERLRRREEHAAALLRRPASEGERAAAKAGLARIQARVKALDKAKTETRPISTAEMRAFAARETGGRPLAFTSDKIVRDEAKATRQANYTGMKPVMPEGNLRNTLQAYRQGLTGMGHESLANRALFLRGAIDTARKHAEMVHEIGHEPPGGYKLHASDVWKIINDSTGKYRDYRPFNMAGRDFYPMDSLRQLWQDAGVRPASAEVGQIRAAFDMSKRMATEENKGRGAEYEMNPETGQPQEIKGQWGMIHKHSAAALDAIHKSIDQGITSRSLRGLTNYWRAVVLSTSAKHVPGVIQESAIRLLSSGAGPRSWLTYQRAYDLAKKQNPEAASDANIALTGGDFSGAILAARTHTVSEHYQGSMAYPVLRGIEAFARTPGVKQFATVWHAWTNLIFQGTKRMISENVDKAYAGRMMLHKSGYADAAKLDGFLGAVKRAMGLHGKALQAEAQGLLTWKGVAQLRVSMDQVGGRWMDLGPAGRGLLNYTPFGLWYINSLKWMARFPTDNPVKAGLLASANLSTAKERKKLGLDPFAKGGPPHVPNYMMGGIPVGGGRVLAQQYYSPQGTLNDPYATAADMFVPWIEEPLQAAKGVNAFGKTLTSPSNPKGYHTPGGKDRAEAIFGTFLDNFIPFYLKAKQVIDQGAKSYDTGGLFMPPTKTKKEGLAEGFWTAFKPYRVYGNRPKSSSGSSGGGGISAPSISSAGISAPSISAPTIGK